MAWSRDKVVAGVGLVRYGCAEGDEVVRVGLVTIGVRVG